MYRTTADKKRRGASACCKSAPVKEYVGQNKNPRKLVFRAFAPKGYLTGVA